MGNSSTRAKNKYNADKYDNLRVVVPKGQKEIIKQHIADYGYKSVNGFVVSAIAEKMEKDKQGK